MEKIVLWDKEIKSSFLCITEDELDDFLKLLTYIQTNDIANLVSIEMEDDSELWEWLGSKDRVELNDMKRELYKRIGKAKHVGNEEFENNLLNVGRLLPVKTLVLLFNSNMAYHISTLSEYYIGLRYYLGQEKKSEFCKDMQECFPNIFFAEDIERTINTLNRNFEDMREEIILHLSKINDYHDKFLHLLSEHKGYREIAQEFEKDTGIECSPQAGRDRVQQLKEKHYNVITNQDETITCELHTKFNKFNIDRNRQDRIYFFPGKNGIQDGKVIVKHIGEHL